MKHVTKDNFQIVKKEFDDWRDLLKDNYHIDNNLLIKVKNSINNYNKYAGSKHQMVYEDEPKIQLFFDTIFQDCTGIIKPDGDRGDDFYLETGVIGSFQTKYRKPQQYYKYKDSLMLHSNDLDKYDWFHFWTMNYNTVDYVLFFADRIKRKLNDFNKCTSQGNGLCRMDETDLILVPSYEGFNHSFQLIIDS